MGQLGLAAPIPLVYSSYSMQNTRPRLGPWPQAWSGILHTVATVDQRNRRSQPQLAHQRPQASNWPSSAPGSEEGRFEDGPVEVPDRSRRTPRARYFRAHHGARTAHHLQLLLVPRQGMPDAFLPPPVTIHYLSFRASCYHTQRAQRVRQNGSSDEPNALFSSLSLTSSGHIEKKCCVCLFHKIQYV